MNMRDIYQHEHEIYLPDEHEIYLPDEHEIYLPA